MPIQTEIYSAAIMKGVLCMHITHTHSILMDIFQVNLG